MKDISTAVAARHTNGAEIRCVELKTGKVVWAQRVNERASLTLGERPLYLPR